MALYILYFVYILVNILGVVQNIRIVRKMKLLVIENLSGLNVTQGKQAKGIWRYGPTERKVKQGCTI